jgi:hypothetical protein
MAEKREALGEGLFVRSNDARRIRRLVLVKLVGSVFHRVFRRSGRAV